MWNMGGERQKQFTQIFVVCLNLCFSPHICDAYFVSGTVHLFDEYFLNTYYMPGTVSEAEDTTINNIDDGAFIVWEILALYIHYLPKSFSSMFQNTHTHTLVCASPNRNFLKTANCFIFHSFNQNISTECLLLWVRHCSWHWGNISKWERQNLHPQGDCVLKTKKIISDIDKWHEKIKRAIW